MLSNTFHVIALLFFGVAVLAECGHLLLFAYCQWLYIQESFWNLFNPFVYLLAAWDLLHLPLFWTLLWVLAGGAGAGFLCAHLAERCASEQEE